MGLFDGNDIYEEKQEIKEQKDKKTGLFGVRRNVAEDKGKVAKIIGVYGAHSGIGVTTTCLILARELAREKKRVIVLERNGDNEFQYVKDKYVDFSTESIADVGIHMYDYIIIDFGEMYKLSKDIMPKILNSKEEIKKRREEYGVDAKYCNVNIIVCSGDIWRLGETKFYLQDVAGDGIADWIKLVLGDSDTREFEKLVDEYYTPGFVVGHKHGEYIKELITEINVW